MKTVDNRGFQGYADFVDTYGGRVRVKESSADPLDKVWVFIDSELDVMMPFGDGADSSVLSDGSVIPNPRRIYISPVGRMLHAAHPVTAAAQGMGDWQTLKASAAAHLSREQARVLRDALDEFLRDQEDREKDTDPVDNSP